MVLLRAEDMTREQLAACKLTARAIAGEHGHNVRMMDMREIVWDGNCSPDFTYSRIMFSIGLDVFSACRMLDGGVYRTEYQKGEVVKLDW